MNSKEAQEAGYKVYCIKCLELFRHLPTSLFEEVNQGRPVPCCPECNGDQFASVADDSKATL